MRQGQGGGPKTASGKQKSSRNAVKHGLTAATHLPSVLGEDSIDAKYQTLRDEFRPQTSLEEYFLRDIARHQAAMDKVEEIEPAVLRCGAEVALQLISEDSSQDRRDAALVGAGSSDVLINVTRYRRTHERAILRNLQALQQLQDRRKSSSRPMGNLPRFESDEDCESYLIGWQLSRFICEHCNSTSAKHVSRAKSLQCKECGRRIGVRRGTVMERSRVGLLKWFCSILAVLDNQAIDAQKLGRAAGIKRQATVRTVRKKILDALNSTSSATRLAGLNSSNNSTNASR